MMMDNTIRVRFALNSLSLILSYIHARYTLSLSLQATLNATRYVHQKKKRNVYLNYSGRSGVSLKSNYNTRHAFVRTPCDDYAVYITSLDSIFFFYYTFIENITYDRKFTRLVSLSLSGVAATCETRGTSF